ncbi:hypothetical protein SAMN05216175_103376 [Neptunomonas qingdaonensis]|uniref:Uncharacterized protein n=1 Tax=Neptunomonas qingdaonensis TaxID=1045558 RepID=A0A1I2PJH6_9GAMM|nr:hypothetical protein SAMN05216175_103376 [Neptunomonas qingdaonensis]
MNIRTKKNALLSYQRKQGVWSGYELINRRLKYLLALTGE